MTRHIEDGHIEIDNNAAERSLRGVVLGRKNYLFAGSDAGGERAAAVYSLIGSAKRNGLPEAYVRQVLTRIADHPFSRIKELPPLNLVAILPEPTKRRPPRQRVQPLPLPDIAELIEDGAITIGMLRPMVVSPPPPMKTAPTPRWFAAVVRACFSCSPRLD